LLLAIRRDQSCGHACVLLGHPSALMDAARCGGAEEAEVEAGRRPHCDAFARRRGPRGSRLRGNVGGGSAQIYAHMSRCCPEHVRDMIDNARCVPCSRGGLGPVVALGSRISTKCAMIYYDFSVPSEPHGSLATTQPHEGAVDHRPYAAPSECVQLRCNRTQQDRPFRRCLL